MPACSEISVGTVLVIDRSVSMLQAMNNLLPSKFEAARIVSRSLAAELLAKDNMAIQSFAVGPSARLGMTNDIAVLTGAINGLAPFNSVLVAEGSSNISAALDLAYATVDACAPADSELSTGSGGDAGAGSAVPSEHNFHGSGPPAVGLGVPGDTYVDDDTNGFYWKSISGWVP